MSLFSELNVDFSESKQISSEKVVLASISSPLVPTFVSGTLKGPIAQGDTKHVLDANGNNLILPANAIVTYATFTGSSTSLPTALPHNLMITFANEPFTDYYRDLIPVSLDQVNGVGGCFAYPNGNTVQALQPGFNRVVGVMTDLDMPADQVVNVKVGYHQIE